MAHHNDLGKYGERLGADYLAQHQFSVLHTNWKYSYYEIDVIASKNNVLHFIEIKTRLSVNFGLPEEGADRRKWQNIQRAAQVFQHRNPMWQRVQYDLLSIRVFEDAPAEYLLIEDVYYW